MPDRDPATSPDGSGVSGQRPGTQPLRTDGLPTLPSGEPVLHRWFVVSLLLIAPVAVGVTIWAMFSVDRDELTAAERRPPGDEQVTIERGAAELAETREVEPGPGCAQGVRLAGDPGSRTTSRLVFEVVCDLIDGGGYGEVRDGLVELIAADGQVRIATFELAGVESSSRVEDERIVVELNAKFQFEDHVRGAPALVHQLVLLSDPDWPGAPITAERELEAVRVQSQACEDLDLDPREVRGCRDVQELLADDDPIELLVEAGYPRA